MYRLSQTSVSFKSHQPQLLRGYLKDKQYFEMFEKLIATLCISEITTLSNTEKNGESDWK